MQENLIHNKPILLLCFNHTTLSHTHIYAHTHNLIITCCKYSYNWFMIENRHATKNNGIFYYYTNKSKHFYNNLFFVFFKARYNFIIYSSQYENAAYNTAIAKVSWSSYAMNSYECIKMKMGKYAFCQYMTKQLANGNSLGI